MSMVQTAPFSEAIAKTLVESTEPFPVDFDDAWKWIGYSRKDSAKRKLENSQLQSRIDYSTELWTGKRGGSPREKIYLSTDAFKHFAMMANTPRGHDVRQYMIEAEKTLRAAMHAMQPQYSVPSTRAEALRLAADEIEKREEVERQLEAAQPAIEFVRTAVSTEGTFAMGEAAKMLGLVTPDGRPIGRNILIKGLREMGVLMKSGGHSVPKQEHINAGRFEVKYSYYKDPQGQEFSTPITRVTSKGVYWIRQRCIASGCRPVNERELIT